MKQQRILYGTQNKAKFMQQAIREAVRVGYRAIDTANCCGYRDKSVGEALKSLYEQGYKREDFWLQSKFTYEQSECDPIAEVEIQIDQSLNHSLLNLQTDYLDSFLLHYLPGGYDNLTTENIRIWRKLEELHKSGLVKSIGVSSISPTILKKLIEIANVKPKVIQNYAAHFDSYSNEMFELCKKHGIEYQGFGVSISTPNQYLADKIAENIGVSSKQVEYRLALQKGITPITGASNPDHMKENIDALNFVVDDNTTSGLHQFNRFQLEAYEILCDSGRKNCAHILDQKILDLAKKFTLLSQVSILQVLGSGRADEALNFVTPEFEVSTDISIQALKFLQSQKSNNSLLPTKEEVALANKLEYEQFVVLEAFGANRIDTALKITSFYGGKALQLLCKTEDGSLRTPTDEDITLANKFTEYEQLDALEALGADMAHHALKVTSYYGGKALKILCKTEDGSLRTPTDEDITIANKFDYRQSLGLEAFGVNRIDTALKITSFYGGKALQLLCKTKDGSLRTPTDEDIALANKFTDYEQFVALEAFGANTIDTALKVTSFYGGKALQLLCKTEDGSLRTPTDEDIALANKLEYVQLEALEALGADMTHHALKITSSYGGKALKILCKTEDGSLRTPTDEDIALANKFTDYEQFVALEAFGANRIDTALKITSLYGGNALKILCKTEDGSLRTPTDEDIALANKFTKYGQVVALEAFGANTIDTALKITSFYGGNALQLLCKTEDGSLRTPTYEDIALANKFTDYEQLEALKALGADMAHHALKVTSFYGGKALKILCKTEDGSLRTPTDEDIALANKFTDYEQIQDLRVLEVEKISTVVNRDHSNEQTLEEVINSAYDDHKLYVFSDANDEQEDSGNQLLEEIWVTIQEDVKVFGEDDVSKEESCS